MPSQIDDRTQMYHLVTSILSNSSDIAILKLSLLLHKGLEPLDIALELVKIVPLLLRSEVEAEKKREGGAREEYWLLLVLLEFLGTVEGVGGERGR